MNSQLNMNFRYKAAVQTIILRENKINDKDKELAAAKTEAAETGTLKQKVKDLESQLSHMREERDKEISRLQGELSRELQGQLRVAESLTQERNLARREVAQLKEKLKAIDGTHADAIKKLEDTARSTTAESNLKHGELQKQLQATGDELAKFKTDLTALQEEKRKLEESSNSTNEKLSSVNAKFTEGETKQARLKEELDNTQKKLTESEKAREQLHQGSRTVNEELAAARSAADEESKKQRDLADQLANTYVSPICKAV